MPSVIEFIAECIAREIDPSDSELSNDTPAKSSPSLSDYFKRNPYYRRHLTQVDADLIIEDATREKNTLKDDKAKENEEVGDIQAQEEEEFVLHLSESEDSQQAVAEQIEDFTLQLSEDEEACNGQMNIEELSKSSQSGNIVSLSVVKHVISDNHIIENSPPVIKCSDNCIVSKELQTSSNEAFEEIADAKNEDAIKQSDESKKRPSSGDTPIKFFKIFRSFFKDSVKEAEATKPNDSHDVPKEVQTANVPEATRSNKSANERKPEETKGKKQLKKTPAEPASKKIHFCTTCRTQVESLTALKQHLRMHSESKLANECSICQRTFATKSVLKRHLLTHSSERRFTCSLCDKKFIRRDNLLRHRKRYHTC